MQIFTSIFVDPNSLVVLDKNQQRLDESLEIEYQKRFWPMRLYDLQDPRLPTVILPELNKTIRLN